MASFALTPRLDALPIELLKIIFPDRSAEVSWRWRGAADFAGWMPFERPPVILEEDGYTDYTESLDEQPFQGPEDFDDTGPLEATEILEDAESMQEETHSVVESEDVGVGEEAEPEDAAEEEAVDSIEEEAVQNAGLGEDAEFEEAYSWQDDLRSLQAISRTCRSLRAFALPLLWSIIQANTMADLARVCDSLDAMPHLGACIRHFAFDWHHADFRWGTDSDGMASSTPALRSFNECITAITAHATLLRSYSWRCISAPMPTAAFEALKRCSSLEALHVEVAYYPKKISGFVPLWELAPQLTELSLSPLAVQDALELSRIPTRPVLIKSDLAHYELPSTCGKNSSQRMLQRVAWRTIVAAAQSGRLRSLVLNELHEVGLWQPFTLRSLLPCWVRIDDWACDAHTLRLNLPDWEPTPTMAWLAAAISLRPALAHMASAAAKRAPAHVDPATARLLTRTDIQSMHAEFRRVGLPVLTQQVPENDWNEVRGRSLITGTPFEQYLSWLVDETDLPQRVADAWNEVVRRGEAETCRCWCEECIAE